MSKKIDSFELVIVVGLDTKNGGFNSSFSHIVDAFDNHVFSSLYCIQYLYVSLMRKYREQLPLYVRFVTFKDFNPSVESFNKDNPFFEISEEGKAYRKEQLLKNPLVISPLFEYSPQKEELKDWLDNRVFGNAVNFYEYPTNGLEALYNVLLDLKEDSHKVIAFVSDNEPRPLGEEYLGYCPERYPKDMKEIEDLWNKISNNSTLHFFSLKNSTYEAMAKKLDNAYFYELDSFMDYLVFQGQW